MQEDFKQRLQRRGVKKIPFNEHMAVVSDETVMLQELDINDDIQREVQF